MIERLRLTNVGVITDAELDLGPGFIAVTGETGAGKTMVLTGIALLTGAKVDSSVIRAGATSCTAEGDFELSGPSTNHVRERIEEAGGIVEDDIALLSRTLVKAGRGRAVVGGRSTPVTVLAELSSKLVAVHGQRDQARLLAEAEQRKALDLYGGHDTAVAKYRDAFAAWRGLEKELAAAKQASTMGRHELEYLQSGVSEIEGVAPEPREDEALAAKLDRLGNAQELVEAAHLALSQLRDEHGAADSVRTAEQSLTRASIHDPGLQAFVARADEIAQLLDALNTDLEAYAAGLDAHPEVLHALELRRSELNALKRKFGPTLEDVLVWFESSQRRILEIDTSPEKLAALGEAVHRARIDVDVCGATLTQARLNAAKSFAAAVTAELHGLAMPNARVLVHIEPRDVPAASGCDHVSIMMATHKDDSERPIGAGASGGELSRIMLAVEVVLASHDPVPTFVFDEVDAGVGGKAAVEIGRRLARLAAHAQVIVVTHLPQVAAFADRHIVVTKAQDGLVNVANVKQVEGDTRVAELARMMAGQEDSVTGAAHAEELLTIADALKREISA